MRRAAIVVCLALASLGVTTGAAGAQTPAQDSVVGSGSTGNGFEFDIDVRSGPGGENPTGEVTFSFTGGGVFFAGTVTCLSVDGNLALIRVQTSQFGVVGLEVTDSPTGDLIRAIPVSTPSPCVPFPGMVDFPVSSGNVVVADAPALPVSKAQCKDGGWRAYGVFKNQGDCVSFVATGGKNQPAGGKQP
jgi:hypothetical protein